MKIVSLPLEKGRSKEMGLLRGPVGGARGPQPCISSSSTAAGELSSVELKGELLVEEHRFS
jgi:hypothetical protein